MDAVSYSHADKQKQRIEKFNANPDSNSGIVTVPKTIGAGESVTVPAGRVAVLPNLQVDGTLNVLGEVFIPAGTTVDMGNGLAINGEKVVMSVPTSYHLLEGNLVVDNSVITQGFNTTLYTGNGSTQSINTGIDMATQWGDTTEEKFGGLVWLKSRSAVTGHFWFDTLRGINNEINSNTNEANAALANSLTSFNNDGFSLGGAAGVGTNAATYASWNFQTTHRITGITNHGKPYTCHYNPYTGFTMVKYEGSGIVGHEIPHHLGRKLELWHHKNLSVASTNWETMYNGGVSRINFNLANAGITDSYYCSVDNLKVSILGTAGTHSEWNTNTHQYIMYGWANSYLDESNKLIGNYEVGVYQGNGVGGYKVTTRGKPAWVMIKRLDTATNCFMLDNQRDSTNPNQSYFTAEAPSAESVYQTFGINMLADGFTCNDNNPANNASGGQYLYMVAYDTNSDGGGSYYPKSTDTANVQINNALIPIAKGSDINGLKNVMVSKNETITGLTYTLGKNYIYCDGNGSYGVKSIAPNYGTTNPANGGDFYSILENKWYTSAGVEITEGRNYLNHIVYADNDGGVLYVEELPKIEYKDEVKAEKIKANEYQGKNACTAWVNFDGTTTPPTIRDSYNVSKVIRTQAGIYDIYFENEMDNSNYVVSGTTGGTNSSWVFNRYNTQSINKFSCGAVQPSVSWQNDSNIQIQIFGGKN